MMGDALPAGGLSVLVAACAVFLGALVQTASGFGMALVAVPVLLWFGWSLPAAVSVALGAAAVQTAVGTWSARASVPWRLTSALAVNQWFLLPVGVGSMLVLDAMDPARTKQLVGALVLALSAAWAVLRPRPRPRLHPGWGVLAATSAGLLSGAVGMGGPPVVFFALAHDWDKDRFRGFLWSQFLLVSPVLAAILALRLGPDILWNYGLGLALAPALWAGTRLGFRVSENWQADRLRAVATLLLVVIGLSSVTAPWLS
jgi:uncharacterized membrane protein YfcA